MADNVGYTPGTGATVAADDIGGVLYQRVKVGVGADGAATDVSTSNPMPVQMPVSMTDSFGKLMTVNMFNDIDLNWSRDSVPANAATITTSGGSVTQANGRIQIATSTSATGEAKVVSTDTVYYRAGGELYCLFTTAFLSTATSTSFQRIGLYTDSAGTPQNGVWIGYEGTTFGLHRARGAGAITTVALASFNGDTLSGAAGSKYTSGGTPQAIDLTKFNVWRLRFGWLGVAPIKLEVLSPDGEWVLCHSVRYPNSEAEPTIYSTELPITAHLKKSSGATDLQLNTACWGAGTTYDKADLVGSYTLGTAANSVVNFNTQMIGTLSVRVGTSTTGSIIFESTMDGSNWITHPYCFKIGGAGIPDSHVTGAVTPTSGDIYRIQGTGFRGIRVRTNALLGAACTLHYHGDDSVSMVTLTPAPITKDLQRISVASSGLTTATTTYSIGDQVGNQFTIAGAARGTGGSGVITGVQIIDASDVIGAMDVVFTDSSVTLAADNAAYAISDSDALKVVGVVNCSTMDIGSNRISQAFNLAIPYVCSGGTSLYAGLITRSANAVFAAGATTVQLIVYVERN